jgi:serine/threonine protein kinase
VRRSSKGFSLATTLAIGTQMVTRLEQIHRKGFVHRDIKANNFMIGAGEDCRTVYIIDFGLAKRYRDLKTGQHIPLKGGKSLVGTARYASIASHEGFEQCRRDDLESTGYLLLYFLIGKLPWQGVQIHSKTEKYAEIGRLKKVAQIDYLLKPFGEDALVLARYFDYVKALKFEEEPNYDFLRKLFRETLLRRKEEHAPLDWERLGPSQRSKRP